MSKIVLLAFTFCTIPVALGSLSVSKSQVQALSLDDTVTIETIDKIPFEVEVRYAQLSQTLSNLIKEAGIVSSLPLECSSYIWSLIQCLLRKVLKVNRDIGAQEAQEEIIEMIQSLDAQNLISFLYAVIYLDIPLLQKLSVDEMVQEKQILAIPAELIASIPGDIRNPIIMRHLINIFGPFLLLKPLAVCKAEKRCFLSTSSTSDGKIVSGPLLSDKGDVRIWDSTTGQQLAVLSNKSPIAVALYVTLDDKVIVGSEDGVIRIWSTTGKQLAVCEGHIVVNDRQTNWVPTLVTTPDGKIVSTSGDKTIRIWDITTGKQFAVINTPTNNWWVIVTPDGKIISGLDDGTIRIWDSTTGQQLTDCKGHTNQINTLVATPDGKIVSASDDATIRIWDSATGQQLGVLDLDCYTALCVTPDGKIVFASWDRDDCKIRILDSATGQLLAELDLMSPTRALCVTSDGKIISGSDDGMIRIWDSTTGQLLAVCKGHADPIIKLVATPDGKFVSVAINGGRIRIWGSAVSLPMNNHQAEKVWLYLQQLIKLRTGTSLMNIFNTAFWHRVGDMLTSSGARWQEIERILSEED